MLKLKPTHKVITAFYEEKTNLEDLFMKITANEADTSNVSNNVQ